MPGRGHLRRGRRARQSAILQGAERRAREGVEADHRAQAGTRGRRRLERRQGKGAVPRTMTRLITLAAWVAWGIAFAPGVFAQAVAPQAVAPQAVAPQAVAPQAMAPQGNAALGSQKVAM